jgi:Phasin protein
MDKPQSGRPANAARPARRSLVEFALPPSGAPVEIPSAARPVRPDKPAKKTSDGGIKIIHEPSDLQTAPDAREPEISIPTSSAGKNTPSVAKVAVEYPARVFELMMANVSTTLEYAQRLVNVKTPTEFVELSMSHGRKQLELVIKQAADLGSIAQELATASVVRTRE